MGIKLITITTLVHSGGNADIGNKLAELLMPELDEKVIMMMITLMMMMTMTVMMMMILNVMMTRLTPQ